MAVDLILGRTRRGWSRTDLGAFPTVSRAQDRERYEDVRAEIEVGDLARATADEIQQSYHRIVRLVTDKRIPAGERRDFGRLLARWQAFSMPREGRWRGADYVALSNFRDANRRVSARLAELEQLPQTSSPSPVTPGQPGPEPLPVGRLIAGVALGIAGMVTVHKIREGMHR